MFEDIDLKVAAATVDPNQHLPMPGPSKIQACTYTGCVGTLCNYNC